MRNPIYRYLTAILVPPILGAFIIHLADLLTKENRNSTFSVIDSLGWIGLYALYGFFFTLLPASLFYLGLTWITKKKRMISESRFYYSVTGLFFGSLCGLTIGLFFYGLAWFIVTGCVVGFVTAWLIYPPMNHQPNKAAHTIPVNAASTGTINPKTTQL